MKFLPIDKILAKSVFCAIPYERIHPSNLLKRGILGHGNLFPQDIWQPILDLRTEIRDPRIEN